MVYRFDNIVYIMKSHMIRVTDADWERAKIIAESENRSVSNLLETCLKDFLALKEQAHRRVNRRAQQNVDDAT
jgi:predicted transcriptional regulator